MNTVTWHTLVFTAIFLVMATGLVTLLLSRSTYSRIKAIPYAFVYGLGAVAWLAALIYAQYVANTFLTHRIAFSAGYVLTLGMLGLALTFPNRSLGKRVRRLLTLDILAGVGFIGLIFFTNYMLTAANFLSDKPASFSLLGKLFLLILAVHFISAIVIFVWRYLREVRNRLYFNYIVLAFIFLVLIGATTNLILPLVGVVSLAIVGPLCALLPFAAVVYALGITDIDDINYVVAQLLQVGARLVAMVTLLVAGWFLHRALSVGYYSAFWIISMGIIAGLGVIGFYLFGSALDTYIEGAIAYSRLSPDKARAKLIVGLSGEIELDRNVLLVLRLIKHALGVRAAGIALLAKDGTFWTSGELTLSEADVSATLKAVAESPVRRTRERALVHARLLPEATMRVLEGHGIYGVKPLHTESGIAGLYMLGEKFSHEIFTKQDASLMYAITEISDLSIERALFYTQIQTFNATLQQRVNSATERLRKANTRLKTLDALKDDFISMASHQLRSPAASVHDAIKMLEQSYLTAAERSKITELADASSERLLNVVTDMLSVARIQAGHFTIEKAEVNMEELVDRALLQASALIAEKHITVRFERPPKAPIIMADRAKMNEIMSNYIENAIKYSTEKTQVKVSLLEAAGKLYFEVTDQGIGVPMAERKDLFSKFYRATNARREHPNGNGIGLFVVKTVVEAHGGRVYYRPLSGGSLFGFWIPSE